MRIRRWKPKYVRLTVEDARNELKRVKVMQEHGLDPSKHFLVRNGDHVKERLIVQWIEEAHEGNTSDSRKS